MNLRLRTLLVLLLLSLLALCATMATAAPTAPGTAPSAKGQDGNAEAENPDSGGTNTSTETQDSSDSNSQEAGYGRDADAPPPRRDPDNTGKKPSQPPPSSVKGEKPPQTTSIVQRLLDTLPSPMLVIITLLVFWSMHRMNRVKSQLEEKQRNLNSDLKTIHDSISRYPEPSRQLTNAPIHTEIPRRPEPRIDFESIAAEVKRELRAEISTLRTKIENVQLELERRPQRSPLSNDRDSGELKRKVEDLDGNLRYLCDNMSSWLEKVSKEASLKRDHELQAVQNNHKVLRDLFRKLKEEFRKGLQNAPRESLTQVSETALKNRAEEAASAACEQSNVDAFREARSVLQRLRRFVGEVCAAAPTSLQSDLKPMATRFEEIATVFGGLADMADGRLKLTVHAEAPTTEADTIHEMLTLEAAERCSELATIGRDPQSAWRELAESLVPSFIDACLTYAKDHGSDAGEFRRRLPEQIAAVEKLVGLTPIDPGKGDAFNPDRHAVLKLIRADDPSLLDRVASCQTKGYAYNGTVIRKAMVVLYQ